MRIEAVSTDERCVVCGEPALFRAYDAGVWGPAFCGAETLAVVYRQLYRQPRHAAPRA